MGFPAVKHVNTSGFFSDFFHLSHQKCSFLFFSTLAYIELLGYFLVFLLLFSLLLFRVLELNCGFIFLVIFPHSWNNLLAVLFIIIYLLKRKWWKVVLVLSFKKCMQSTVCLFPYLGVDSQFVRDLAGMAQVVSGCHPPSFPGVSSSNSSSGVMMLCVFLSPYQLVLTSG